MKQMADNPWDIPNLDITVDRNGRKISYNGMIYRDINTLKSVSYTHLDVYKRQTFYLKLPNLSLDMIMLIM